MTNRPIQLAEFRWIWKNYKKFKNINTILSNRRIQLCWTWFKTRSVYNFISRNKLTWAEYVSDLFLTKNNTLLIVQSSQINQFKKNKNILNNHWIHLNSRIIKYLCYVTLAYRKLNMRSSYFLRKKNKHFWSIIQFS